MPGVTQRETQYVFTDDMDEISGFGGGYEQTCRNMLAAALEWLDEHPQAEPKFKGFKEVYGILMEDNEDAKALSKAATDAALGDCTGAMHQATISHALWIKRHSWREYCQKMRERKGSDA